MKRIFLLSVLFICARMQAQDTARTDASVRSATVYFGYGAELTHDARIRVGTGTRTIVIDQLCFNIDPASLQVNLPDELSLLSQHFEMKNGTVTVPDQPEQVSKLQDSIVVLRKENGRLANSIQIEEETLGKTGLLIESYTGGNADRSLLSAELLKLVDYYTAKIEKSRTNIYNLRQQSEANDKRIEQLNKKINDVLGHMVAKATKPSGQLVLQVICNKAGEYPVAVSYYTRQAGWTPVYDVRVDSKSNKVKLVYKASLTQSTEIDWKKVKLTLSTGTPNFGVAAPILNAWYLQLYVPELYRSLNGKVSGLNVNSSMMNSIPSMDDKALSEVVVVGYGSAKKDLQIRGVKEVSVDPSTLDKFTTLNEGQLNTNFEIDLPYDIASDGQLHMVNIKETDIQCTLKNYAVPRLDKESYLLAEVADWQNLDLLPGEANIIMDNTYIGRSLIDPNSTSDTLNLSLGRDKRLAVKRTLVKELSSIKTSGSTSKRSFTYEIVVKNNKLTDVNMILKDQYPLSTIKEVEVKLDDSGEASVNEELGVLTWKLNLKPGESRKIRFSYSVKYPKDQKFVNLN